MKAESDRNQLTTFFEGDRGCVIGNKVRSTKHKRLIPYIFKGFSTDK
jgi:hypothetical protein